MTAVYEALSAQEKKEISMYGCTKAEMIAAVEDSLAFKFSGAAMYAAGMLSDCQEMLQYGGEDYMVREDVRQMMNRAKWVLSTYLMK